MKTGFDSICGTENVHAKHKFKNADNKNLVIDVDIKYLITADK